MVILAVSHIFICRLFWSWGGRKVKHNSKIAISIGLYGIILLVATLVTGFLMMTQHKLQIGVTMDWVIGHPAHFFFSVLFIFLVFLLFFALFGYYYGILGGTALLCLLGIVHYFKLMIRAEPLFLDDYTQISLLKSVLPMVMNVPIIIGAIIACILIGVLIYIRRFFPKIRQHLAHRMVVFLVAVFGIYSYLDYSETFMGKVFEKSNIEFISWFEMKNYSVNGPVLGFISNALVETFPEPDGYSEEAVIQLAEELRERYSKSEATNEETPNIIYMMSEAFFDPTRMENLQFEPDPLVSLRSYLEEYPSGFLLSSVYGGSTVNVEFEALTGFSMYFLKDYSIPYQTVVDRQESIPTVVSLLQGKGYEAIALHPYLRTFYKRDRVYDVFGFDSFISMEEMSYTETVGEYISDQSVANEMMLQLKAEDAPLFIHTVTMQNHFPFREGQYGENEVSVSGLEGSERTELEEYAQGVKISAEVMADFFQRLDTFDEPTIVVFWGDHLPALGENQSTYKNAGFIRDGTTPEEIRLMAETPLLFYANFDIESSEIGTLSANYLSPTLFEMLGFSMPVYYQFLAHVKSEIPGIRSGVKIGSDNEVLAELTQEQEQLLREYELIQYDLLMGGQYSREILFE